MTDAKSWAFDPTCLDPDGAMTLVLARRRGARLIGGKVEFAKDADAELRTVVRRSADSVATLIRRTYEPSLVIGPGEYLAAPDGLVDRAAPPPVKQSQSGEAGKGVKQGGGQARNPATEDGIPKVVIETDPQVRGFLRRASGLELLPAQDLLRKPPFLFYAVVIGDDPQSRIAFVRKMSPTRTLDAGKLLFAYGNRLTRVTEPLLAIEDHFDLIVTKEGIAVLNQTVFEALFRDAETLVERYPVWASSFSTLGLSDLQTKVLVERCQRDSRLASRLRQIYESGHLAAGQVTKTQVLKEADRVAGGRARFLKNGELDFGCQDASALLKLLNDDLFVGGLSHQPFEAGSKARYATN